MSVVGDGDVASVIPRMYREFDDILFFASGVSNSQETRESEYEREIDLLLEQRRDVHLVYFSSLSIFYSHTRYAQHKRDMEQIVKANFPEHTIIRLGNITWGDNPHTLINYLKAHPKAEIRDEYRYICDKDEFLHWVRLIPLDFNCDINIPGKRLKIKEIVDEYVRPPSTKV